MSLGIDSLGVESLGVETEQFRASFDLEPPDGSQSILQIASLFDRELIARLSEQPNDLRTMGRREFERLVAELFAGFGYEVELTQRTRDGGKDIIAIRRSEVDTRFLIECKRPDPGNPIGVSTVRELYGVKIDDGATMAILATTTYFSLDAKQFSERHRWELDLRDFDAIHQWIRRYLQD